MSPVDLAKTALNSAGSIMWLPAAFGYGLLDIAGPELGIVFATLLFGIGAYDLADKAGITE
ncbi:hypothetical protein C464_08205 [Halorubrum coriense DSM 10284]|uniref:Uncharacterized protein n=2 Tax=Halorubrum coriense TaxID=64713 RepID=M0ENB3_9EURY|nr:hypothetical protein C464_08205 [Halorubrum coriense DSM 10284]